MVTPRRPSAVVAVLALVAAGLSTAFIAPAAAIPPTIAIGPNGSVNSVIADGAGGAYVGGSFDAWGYQTGGIAAYSATSGAFDTTFPTVDGVVLDAVPDGLGGWFIAGYFDEVGGEDRENLAHIDATGEVTDWAPKTDDLANSIALSGSTVFVGGRFEEVSEDDGDTWLPHLYVASFDAGTGALNSWDPDLADTSTTGWWNLVNSGVHALAVIEGVLYMGGNFSKVGSATRTGAAAFDVDALSTDQGLLADWAPNTDGPVLAIELSAGGIVLGGIFENVGSVTPAARVSLAEVKPSGVISGAGQPTTLVMNVTDTDPDEEVFPGMVQALASDGTALAVGGLFDGIGTAVQDNIAVINSSTNTVETWNPAVDGGIQALAYVGSDLVIGGSFESLGVESRGHAARFTTLNGVPTSLVPESWNPSLDDSVSTIVVSGSSMLMGGYFTLADCAPVNNLVRLGADGTRNLAFSASGYLDSEVTALALFAGSLAVAEYSPFAGPLSNGGYWVHQIETSSGAWVSTAAYGDSPSGVTTMQSGQSMLFIGGDLTSVVASTFPASRSNGLAIDTSWLPTEWNPPFAGAIEAFHLDGGYVYAVGMGPQSGSYVGYTPFAVRAADTGIGAIDTSWSVDFELSGAPSVYGTVFSIGSWGGNVVIGGRMLGSTDASDDGHSLIAVSAADASVRWLSTINGRSRVYAMAQVNDSLVIGGLGDLSTSRSPAVFSIAALDGPSAPVTRQSWAPDVGGYVFSLALSGDKVFAGGDIFDYATNRLYVFNFPAPSPPPAPSPDNGGGGSPGQSTSAASANNQTPTPAPSTAARPAATKVVTLSVARVWFERKSARLSMAAKRELRSVASNSAQARSLRVTGAVVKGRISPKLARDRATAVKEFLRANGVVSPIVAATARSASRSVRFDNRVVVRVRAEVAPAMTRAGNTASHP